MSASERLTIDQHWDRLLVLAEKAGASSTDRWELVDANHPENNTSGPRTPWLVRNKLTGRTILTLGYTRRDAAQTLMNYNSILAVLLGA